jgi:hypothetical protein
MLDEILKVCCYNKVFGFQLIILGIPQEGFHISPTKDQMIVFHVYFLCPPQLLDSGLAA